MSIIRKPFSPTPIPDDAPHLYVVTSGECPKIETYRLKKETDLSYQVYYFHGGTYNMHKSRLKHWGYRAFHHHTDAVKYQREQLTAALARHEQACEGLVQAISDHFEQWGQL